MSIHSEHPFLPPEDERNPLRRFRGRLGSAVSLWTAYDSEQPVGLTVSSMLVADGEPGRVLGLLDPDSDLFEALVGTGVFVVALLGWPHRGLADAFAGVAPAPGGPFRMASWRRTDYGPVLDGAAAWVGCRLERDGTKEVGWSMLVEGLVDRVEIGPEVPPLLHRRGRYFTL